MNYVNFENYVIMHNIQKSIKHNSNYIHLHLHLNIV